MIFRICKFGALSIGKMASFFLEFTDFVSLLSPQFMYLFLFHFRFAFFACVRACVCPSLWSWCVVRVACMWLSLIRFWKQFLRGENVMKSPDKNDRRHNSVFVWLMICRFDKKDASTGRDGYVERTNVGWRAKRKVCKKNWSNVSMADCVIRAFGRRRKGTAQQGTQADWINLCAEWIVRARTIVHFREATISIFVFFLFFWETLKRPFNCCYRFQILSNPHLHTSIFGSEIRMKGIAIADYSICRTDCAKINLSESTSRQS